MSPFSSSSIILGSSVLTASGNALFLNGVPITSFGLASSDPVIAVSGSTYFNTVSGLFRGYTNRWRTFVMTDSLAGGVIGYTSDSTNFTTDSTDITTDQV